MADTKKPVAVAKKPAAKKADVKAETVKVEAVKAAEVKAVDAFCNYFISAFIEHIERLFSDFQRKGAA